ncbi:MAG: hypothetical protein QW244_03410 [Candidatus Pacearchaeota archaeon]
MNPDIIETICEILKAKEIDFINKNKEFVKDFKNLAASFANLVQSYKLKSKKAGVGYTFFMPDDATFSSGKWGDISPTIFWGMNNEEIKRIKFSCYLYYNIWSDENLSYTILWNEKLSRYLPYNLEIRMNKHLNNPWKVELKKNYNLIRIMFSKKIHNELSQKFDTIYNKNQISFNNIKIKVEKEERGLSKVSFNFRDFRDIKSQISINDELKNDLEELTNNLGEEIKKTLNGEICKLEKKIKKEIIEKLSEDLPKTVLKLLLIGPYPPKFLRLISPKQYIINNNYVGCFAGILRIYEEKINDNTLQEIYKTALPSLSIVGFRFTTSYFYTFIKNYALRSAVAAIMSRNMSHNIGSHVLNYLSNPEELDNLWVI